jgi:hypothetical protein
VERGLEALLMLQSTLVESALDIYLLFNFVTSLTYYMIFIPPATLCLRVLGMYGHTAWVKVSLGIGGAVTAGLGLVSSAFSFSSLHFCSFVTQYS